MAEKLTDEERAFLGAKCSSPLPAKALRIIDAQAAVIERVRLIALQSAGLVAEDIRRALAAAPEHTAPEAVRGEGLESELAAANARVAEQRESIRIALAELNAANARVAELTEQRESVLALAEERVKAANARADAAERDKLSAEAQANDWKRSLQRAESEAASLRAESSKFQDALGDALAAVERQQKESAALRAEVERLTKDLAFAHAGLDDLN